MFVEVDESGVSSVDDRANVRKCRFNHPRLLGRPAGARLTLNRRPEGHVPVIPTGSESLAVTLTAFTPTRTRPFRVSITVACLTPVGGV